MKLLSIIESIVQSQFDELDTKEKEVFGKGTEHVLYHSKQYPDKLYKVGLKPTVQRWVKIFKSNKKLFPKVFRVGSLYKDNDKVLYVLIEKVDTQRVIDEWDRMEKALEEIGYIDTDSFGNIDYLFREILFDEDYGNEVYSSLRNYNQEVYNLFVKWTNFLHTVNKIVQPIKNGTLLDVHRYNFGYNSKGNMICLDI
jgi:hypothetical protein